MRTRVCAGLTAVAVAVALGCGGGEGDKKQAAEQPCPSAPAEMSGRVALPTGFPESPQITYTGQVGKGATTSTVTGYFAGDIGNAYNTYKQAFLDPFEITDSKHEEADAEIEFKGNGKKGQVKLLQRCKDRTSVTLTIRPA
jgi:hypothetical protein